MSSVVLAATACYGDLPTYPTPGVLRVDVATTGEDVDLDGYAIVIDGGRMATIGVANKSGSFFLPVGSHTVSIGDVAPNCSVTGATTLQAEVTQSQAVTVAFAIDCVGTGVRITTTTTGPDNPVNYKVTVGGRPTVAVATNGTHTIGRLAPGTHAVTLTVPEHCTVDGSNPLSVVVADKGYAGAAFTVVCAPVTRREKIAYVVSGALSTIEMITPDGSRVDRLEDRGYSIAWKRDGSQLAVSDAVCDEFYYYYYAEYCSGGLYLTDPELGTTSRLAGSDGAFRPAWSPVRDQLVFDKEGQDFGPGRVSQLFVLDAGASAAQVIFLAGERMMIAPSWAPDGERVAYVCAPENGNPDLCVVNRDGSGYRRLTTEAKAELDPAWSPDGRTIAFTRIWPDGAVGGDIALLDVASGAITQLGAGSDPAWSPDGSRIVFVTGDGLFVMNADGSNRRRLTTGRHVSPAWRPIR